jgi:CelD/BcsL family acetyltransferase involved in cellulose biosynthesis
VKTRVIDIGSVTPVEDERWRLLATRAAEPNPFFEPDFLGLAAAHFDGYARTKLVVVEDDGGWRGMLPIVDTGRRRNPPRPVGTTRGRPTAVSGVATPLIDRDHLGDATGALLQGLADGARRRELPGIVCFDPLGDEGPVATALRAQAKAQGVPVFTAETWARGAVTRQGRMDNPLDGQRRRSIGRRRRQITKERGEEVTIVDRSADAGVADVFLEMEAAGWKGRGDGAALARSAESAAWFRQWCARWSGSGRLTVLSVEAGTTPIAMQCFVRAGEGIFLVRIAYNEDYGRYAPGAMLIAAVIEHVHQHTDAQWIDSNTDKGNTFSLEMLPERRSASTVLLGTGGILDRRVVAALPAITKLTEARRDLRARLAKRRRPPATDASPPANGSPVANDAPNDSSNDAA